MENEKDTSLDKSVEIEKIIEFYKDKEFNDSEIEVIAKKKLNKLSSFFTKIKPFKNKLLIVKKKTVSILNKLPFVNIDLEPKKSDDEIITHSFGLSEKGKLLLLRTVSAIISVLIIGLSIILTVYLPGNEQIIEQRINELRASEDYSSIKSSYESVKNEVTELITSNNTKEETIRQITDIDNTKAELRTQINNKKYELIELNSQISQKKEEIASLDKSISEKAPVETIYTPGKYTVGKHFSAGKYLVTGTGKFMVATSEGKSKLNISLGSTPLEVTLDNSDIVKFDSKVKFTAIF